MADEKEPKDRSVTGLVLRAGAIAGAILSIVAVVSLVWPDDESPPARQAGTLSHPVVDRNVPAGEYGVKRVRRPPPCRDLDVARADPRPLGPHARDGALLAFATTGGTGAGTGAAGTSTGPAGTSGPAATTGAGTGTGTGTGTGGPRIKIPVTSFGNLKNLIGGQREGTQLESSVEKLTIGTRTTDQDYVDAAVARGGLDHASPAELKKIAASLLGHVVNFRVRIEGMVGRCAYVRWSLFDAREQARVRERWLRNRDALFLVPDRLDDEGSADFWVPLPRRPGPYYVRIELFDDSGGRLDFANTKRFR